MQITLCFLVASFAKKVCFSYICRNEISEVMQTVLMQ